MKRLFSVLMAVFAWCQTSCGVRGSVHGPEAHHHDAEIAELETIIGAALPPDYRQWLQSGDLTVPAKDFYWVVPGEWGSGIECFYGFQPPYDLREFNRERKERKIPADLLLIGDDGMAGTSIALGISGRRTGAVYFIDTTGVEYGSVASDHSIHLIGKSFSSWTKALSTNPDEG